MGYTLAEGAVVTKRAGYVFSGFLCF